MRAPEQSQRPGLRLVDPVTPVEWSWFCGHCAAPSRIEPPPPNARVCHSCNLGLLIEARSDAIPQYGDPFVVIDRSLMVQAVSREAERLLGMSEDEAVNRPIPELLVPADAEARGPSAFAAAVAEVMTDEEPAHTYVRPWNTFGVRMRVRIAACGPPRAALVVVEDVPPSGLRLV